MLSPQPLGMLDGATTFGIKGRLQLLIVWLLARHWMQRRGSVPDNHDETSDSR
jgi:hypothetical protein